MELWLAVSFALGFAFTNGFHDAANAIATLVATRGAGPAPAIALSATFNLLGALLVGTAVADTIAGIVTVDVADAVAAIGAGALAAVLWNLLTWWRGLPSSSGHALVGGLVGAALAAGGLDAVRWGGLDGWKPVGVFGVLIALAVSPVLGLAFGVAAIRLSRRAAASRDAPGPASDRLGAVGDVGRALLQPRGERRAEGDGRRRRAPRRGRPPGDIRRAALGRCSPAASH